MLSNKRSMIPAVLVISVLAGCGGGEPEAVAPLPQATAPAAASLDTLVAELEPVGDTAITGVVVLNSAGEQLAIGAAIDNISPGEHGIAVIESGDCAAQDGESRASHFDLQGRPHGGPEDSPDARHAGDFGNFTADRFEQGKFWITLVSDEPLESYDGRAIVIYAGADDLVTQPSGDSGAVIGCGLLSPLRR